MLLFFYEANNPTIITTFFSSNGLADNVEITVGYIDKINPPFVFHPDHVNSDNSGITFDILKQLEKSIGIIIDFSIKNDLQKMNLNYEKAPSILSNLKKLKNKRLDAVINYASQTDITLYKYPEEFKSIEKLEVPFKKKDKYLMFSHDFYTNNKALVETLWDELKKMRETGELNKISDKYWN